MSPMLITFIVIPVAVFAVAIWMDVKRRRFGDTKSSGDVSRSRRQTRMQDREKDGKSYPGSFGYGG